jgi:Tol biopolymer transport system component
MKTPQLSLERRPFDERRGREVRLASLTLLAIALLLHAAGLDIVGRGLAQETAGWAGAKVTKTDLLIGETNYGKFAYMFASAMTRAGCHVAKVEGERGKELFVRRDGRRGKAYADIAHPVFSSDGSALGYAVRGGGGSQFIINDQEGSIFDEVIPDTFVFSNDGKRHAYLARKAGRFVAVVDGVLQAEAGEDMVPWHQPPCPPQLPVFSEDGSSVGYLEGSRLGQKMRVVVNGKPGEVFDEVYALSLRISPDGTRFSYSANDRSAGSRWFCVIDGKQRDAFDALGVSFAISPDGKRIAYTGRRGQQRFLVVDGEPEVPIEGIVDHSLTFSPDGRRLAYAVAKADRRAYLVVDGKAGPVHDAIGSSLPPGVAPNRASMQTVYGLGFTSSVLFSPDSRRIAYLSHSGRMKRVYVDGKADDVEIEYLVSGMVFSDDSKRLAYGGRGSTNSFVDKFFLVVDGKKGAEYDALGYFGFSPDGKHIAFTAKKGAKCVIVVDGQERGEYDSVPAGPVFRSDGVLEFLAADRPSLYRIEVRDL